VQFVEFENSKAITSAMYGIYANTIKRKKHPKRSKWQKIAI